MADPELFPSIDPEEEASRQLVDDAYRLVRRVDALHNSKLGERAANAIERDDRLMNETPSILLKNFYFGRAMVRRLSALALTVQKVAAIEVAERGFIRKYDKAFPHAGVERGPVAESYAANVVFLHEHPLGRVPQEQPS